MHKRTLGRTGLEIAPLVFGGNVFGWTADERTSFDLLDRFVDAGLDAIDTADVYSRWAPGNSGGESETIIGNWLKKSGKRDKVVLITKVGSDIGQGRIDLSPMHIEKAVEASLKRLQTDVIDLYLSHWPDPTVPHAETLGAYQRLIEKGKVRHVGASNLDAGQLKAALDAADHHSLPRYEVLQPAYNLYDRSEFDGPLRDLCMARGIGVISYYGLAKGFLSGKYRSKADLGKSTRGSSVVSYLNERGMRILAALDDVSGNHGVTQAQVALAWIMARPGITAPIASATSLEQLESLIGAVSLKLSEADMKRLDTASAP
ncbi:aldo/keto reductase [Aquamicrobium defluvii]|uniref:Alcohol dehydrogenase n=1 Tax=Aquamicrobium defluvii TaxID=69279 RepID=A0A011U201_9HYPH|nr:aldo/keto reductase [Aquamicrobium defluvii]EXL10432.1 alcohol dehydrogenase [Aquamicrobium defluvii]EZQ17609.1 alcohol dehydrogenase [Halopseudomonas bauzanensis]TDR37231.1 aryl-alcohol dehydrogenase-like predicted oxidoreductase [Aquamicrobium defluvii]